MTDAANIVATGFLLLGVGCGYIGIGVTEQDDVADGASNAGGEDGQWDDGDTPPDSEGAAPSADDVVPEPACAGSCERVQDDLLVLYDFNEGEGIYVLDKSGQEPSLDLVIEDPEKTRWLESGLELKADTRLSSKVPASRLAEAIEESQELTLEAWVHPADALQSGPARFFTVSADAMNRNFTLGQDKGHFMARLRTSESSENGLPALYSRPVVAERLSHVVFTHPLSGEEVLYLDGEVIGRREHSGEIDDWSDEFFLAVGNEFTDAGRAWHGKIYLIAVYGRALSAEEVIQNAHSAK